MNKEMEQMYGLNRFYSGQRDRLMAVLTDQNLLFALPNNPTLGELCKEIGEIQQAYIDSFRALTQSFDYRHPDPDMAKSVEKLKAWYGHLDDALKTVVEALTDADVQDKIVDRGSFKLRLPQQLDVYREALLIFYGKVHPYLKAMNKQPLPDRWHSWIG